MSSTESKAVSAVFIFPPFSLDLMSHRLEKENEPLLLTPKAFALLRYLIEHADRLVTKTELLDVVWEGAIVGDAVVRVCMNEVRKVLGDNPDEPRYIETVHRKGYRFIGKVIRCQHSVTSSEEERQTAKIPSRGPEFRVQSHDRDPALSSQSPVSMLLGREAELEQMHRLFAKAVSNECQIVFLNGEAGVGKTTLVEAFLRSLVSPPPNPRYYILFPGSLAANAWSILVLARPICPYSMPSRSWHERRAVRRSLMRCDNMRRCGYWKYQDCWMERLVSS